MANEGSGTVSIIDGSTNRIVDTISGIPHPVQLVYNPSNHYMYVAGHNSNSVSIISGSTNKVIDTITVGQGPVSPVFDPNNGNVYVTNFNSNESPGNNNNFLLSIF